MQDNRITTTQEIKKEKAPRLLTLSTRCGPDGLHLFDRATGTNLLLDELRFPSSDWSKAPRHVSVALTNACDLACKFCYAPKNPAFLSASKIISWANELSQHGCFGLGFGGGEPTLHPDLAYLCKKIRANTGLAISITTHGHHLNLKLLENLVDAVDLIRISIDGCGDTYEKIRGRSFINLKNNAMSAASSFRVAVNCVVNGLTINELTPVAELAEELNASQLLLLPEISYGRGCSASNSVLVRLKNWVSEYQGCVPIGISENHKELIQHELPTPKESPLSAYAHIDAESNIRPHSFSNTRVSLKQQMSVIQAMHELNNRIKQ